MLAGAARREPLASRRSLRSWLLGSLALLSLGFAFNLRLLSSRASSLAALQDPSRRAQAHERSNPGLEEATKAPATPPSDPLHPHSPRHSPSSSPPLSIPPSPNARTRGASSVIVGRVARVSVLTLGTVRLEHAGRGKLDDRPSFVVVHRHTPPVEFSVKTEECRLLSPPAPMCCLVVRTSLLRLEYAVASNGSLEERCSRAQPAGALECAWEPLAFTPHTLMVEIQMNDGKGSLALWWPDKPNPGQLPGTVRTLDKVKMPHSRKPCLYLLRGNR